jgi:hypothetical protein
MKFAALALLLATAAVAPVDKAFISAGKVDIHLDGGEYEVRAASDNHVRVTMTGNTGNAIVDVAIAGTHADVTVKNTPHSNFRCVIEVPKVSDVAIRLSGGDLTVGEIIGSKDIEATAGDVKIASGDPNSYSKVDARVRVGDLSGGPFGGAQGGFLTKTVNWSGKGKYTLHATLGAGDLKLR